MSRSQLVTKPATGIITAMLCMAFLGISYTQTQATNGADSTGLLDDDQNLVEIQDEGFVPQQLNIVQGDTVTWINEGSNRYTVTSWTLSYDEDYSAHVTIGQSFDSGDIYPDQSFSITFDRAGTYEYLSLPILESPGDPLFMEPALTLATVKVAYEETR